MFNGNFYQATHPVAVGTPAIHKMDCQKPWTYGVTIPDIAGASALVEFTLSPWAAINAGTANWFPLGADLVASGYGSSVAPVSALRCTANGSPCTLEVVQ